MKLNFSKENIWVTSDTHYGHMNICTATSSWEDKSKCRKFSSLEEMNECLIQSINLIVKRTDILIHLGDWSMGGRQNITEFRKRLDINKIYLVTGNHDSQIRNKAKNSEYLLFTDTDRWAEIKVDKHRFYLQHTPNASWEGLSQGVMHLHGHIHSKPGFTLGPGRMMDVGIDGHPDFIPYNLHEDIVPMLKHRPLAGLLLNDHHGKDN